MTIHNENGLFVEFLEKCYYGKTYLFAYSYGLYEISIQSSEQVVECFKGYNLEKCFKEYQNWLKKEKKKRHQIEVGMRRFKFTGALN